MVSGVLLYHLDIGVASDCPSVGAMPVTMPTGCERYLTSGLPPIWCFVVFEYHLDHPADVGVAFCCFCW